MVIRVLNRIRARRWSGERLFYRAVMDDNPYYAEMALEKGYVPDIDEIGRITRWRKKNVLEVVLRRTGGNIPPVFELLSSLPLNPHLVDILKIYVKYGLALNYTDGYNSLAEIGAMLNLVELASQSYIDDRFPPISLHQIIGSDTTPEYIDVLVEKGADVNEISQDGSTLLHTVALTKNVRLLEYLLRYISPNARDNQGNTPLFSARKEMMARVLIQHGARPDIKNDQGEEPWMVALKRNYESGLYLASYRVKIPPGADILIEVSPLTLVNYLKSFPLEVKRAELEYPRNYGYCPLFPTKKSETSRTFLTFYLNSLGHYAPNLNKALERKFKKIQDWRTHTRIHVLEEIKRRDIKWLEESLAVDPSFERLKKLLLIAKLDWRYFAPLNQPVLKERDLNNVILERLEKYYPNIAQTLMIIFLKDREFFEKVIEWVDVLKEEHYSVFNEYFGIYFKHGYEAYKKHRYRDFDPGLFWIENYKDGDFSFTDDLKDMFVMGRGPYIGSCFSYDSEMPTKLSLLGAIANPWTKMFQIKEGSKLISRVLVHLLEGRRLLIEYPYGKDKQYLREKVKEVVNKWKKEGHISEIIEDRTEWGPLGPVYAPYLGDKITIPKDNRDS